MVNIKSPEDLGVIQRSEGRSCSGNNSIATGMVIYGVSTACMNSYVEYVCNGVQIGTSSTSNCSASGAACDTHAVIVSNVHESPAGEWTTALGHKLI